ncbi:MAG TPA: TonB-dependent siderophore receptor, partial [Burkholderiaceae bacterium]|nr:TonB-dependent siderophore receptor [Burkholderiaceae bacterium]
MARHFATPLSRLSAPRAITAAAAALLAANAGAQTTPTPATQLPAVTVTGRASPPLSVGGWGDVPLAATPIQASIFDSTQWKDAGVQRLADLTRIDPAVSDAYNAEGYWDFLSVRGYVLDNRFNFRRDGLPINAETSIPLDNKARLEILKGTSGMQAGTSAPGGLVNYVVKRPLDAPLRSASLEWVQPGTLTGAVDLSQRFGADQAFGVRVNAAAAHLDPMVRNSEGNRQLFALAADWRVSPDTLLEAEVETSHRSQPSQPGFSMLGDRVPPPGDPRLSLNNQPWSLPVVFDATTASLRWQQKLAAGWSFTAHAATQRLRTDDRLAFPFGCFDPNPAPDGTYYATRYCPNGTYDLYDYRSEDERRRQDALDLSVRGKLQTGALAHALTLGVQSSRVRNRFGGQAYNFVGTGNVDGSAVTPPDPAQVYTNTNRDERSTELYARDAINLTERLTAWLGVRHTRIQRDSVQTDGSAATASSASFTTPSVALGFAFARDQLVYASWGRGVESAVVSNLPRYTNPGVTFTTKSRQAEVGLKGASDAFDWNLALFDIQRPRTQDFGSCDADATCTTRLDGTAHHRGAEVNAAWRAGPWTLRGGAQWLRARIESSQDASVEGRQPTNVPARTLKLQGDYDVAALPGLNLQAGVAYESRRMVLPDNSASIPGYARADAGLRYATRVAGTSTTWRAGIDNLFDKRAWRESPYEFSHVYLYPLAPRTLRLSVQVDL